MLARLVQLHTAISLAHGDLGVTQFDQVFALQFSELGPCGLGRRRAVVGDDDEISHVLVFPR